MNIKTQTAVTDMLLKFQKTYHWLEAEEVEELYDRAFSYYIHLAYPLRHDILELPDERIGDINLIKEMMIDLLERTGASNFTAYSENGLSFQFNGSLFDDKFASMIIPNGKVYRK